AVAIHREALHVGKRFVGQVELDVEQLGTVGTAVDVARAQARREGQGQGQRDVVRGVHSAESRDGIWKVNGVERDGAFGFNLGRQDLPRQTQFERRAY